MLLSDLIVNGLRLSVVSHIHIKPPVACHTFNFTRALVVSSFVGQRKHVAALLHVTALVCPAQVVYFNIKRACLVSH